MSCINEVFVILQLLGKVHRFPAPVCECSFETDRVKSSVSNCGVSGSAFQIHLQPGKDGFISNHHVYNCYRAYLRLLILELTAYTRGILCLFGHLECVFGFSDDQNKKQTR